MATVNESRTPQVQVHPRIAPSTRAATILPPVYFTPVARMVNCHHTITSASLALWAGCSDEGLGSSSTDTPHASGFSCLVERKKSSLPVSLTTLTQLLRAKTHIQQRGTGRGGAASSLWFYPKACDFSLPPRFKYYSGLLRSLKWFDIDVSGLSVPSSRVTLLDTWRWYAA